MTLPEDSSLFSDFSISFWIDDRDVDINIGLFQWATSLNSGGPFIALIRNTATNVRVYFNQNYQLNIAVPKNVYTYICIRRNSGTDLWYVTVNEIEQQSSNGIGAFIGDDLYFGNAYGGSSICALYQCKEQ